MKHSCLVVGICALVVGAAPACATKAFVRQSVGEVSNKVDTLSNSLEETQDRVRQNEAKIGEVEQRAAAADQAAGQAHQTANSANRAAGAAADIGRKADARTASLEAESRKLIFETLLSEDCGNFKLDSPLLPDDAKTALDEMVAQLKTVAKNVWVEIEGHTDSSGDANYNDALGLRRAEAVKQYLHGHHGLPLHKINIFSYGEQKPVAPNSTREGRAQNRRVVIKILG